MERAEHLDQLRRGEPGVLTDPSDRQGDPALKIPGVKLVHLTEAGRAVQVRAVELLSRPPKRFADLTPAELHTLHRLLARVTDGAPFADRSASSP